jgi:hypothetical protein
VTTPLNWREWDSALATHPDQRFRNYIVSGIRYGFRLGFDYGRECTSANRNMATARTHAEVIRQYLAEECAESRVLGPINPEDLVGVQVSRFGVIPKSTAGKWRLIVDHSAPEGGIVNDWHQRGAMLLIQAQRLLLKSGKAKATPTSHTHKPHPHGGCQAS